MTLGKPILGEISSYSISFTTDFPIDTKSGCLVRYEFPIEIDATDLNLDTIQATGLFASSMDETVLIDQSSIRHNLDSGETPQWIIVPGCQ
jgi:hypothetical protein